MDDTPTARSVNRAPTTILELVLDAGGGMIPETGIFTATIWARLLGVNHKTFRTWVDNYKIPYRLPGREMLIDAADLLRHIPYMNGEAANDPKPNEEG